MTKTPIPRENSQTSGKPQNATKIFDYTTIVDRLGRSVRVKAVIQLVWLNRFMGIQPSHLPQKPCNLKDTHLKICK